MDDDGGGGSERSVFGKQTHSRTNTRVTQNGCVKGLGGPSGVYIYTNLLSTLKPTWCNSYIVVSL